MNKEKREKTEWLNTWISGANTTEKRILLIGDSVTRRIRGELEGFTEGEYRVDLFAASYSFEDERLLSSFRDFIFNNEYHYETVVINYGFHHGFSLETYASESDYNIMRSVISEMIDICKEVTDLIFLMNGTEYCIKDKDIVGDHDEKKEMASRNGLYKDISEERAIPLINLNQFISNLAGFICYEDEVHPEKDVDLAVSFMITEKVYEALGIWDDRTRDRKENLFSKNCNKRLAGEVLKKKVKSRISFYRWICRLFNKLTVCMIVLNRKMMHG